MKLKCDYCGSYISEQNEHCPSCGAINPSYKNLNFNTPKTIEELKEWYKAKNLPPENVTRFFIGKNIKEPRAFGIYEENGLFTVYKNKNDGSRAIRYEGTDEAYAVNELYMRLKEEINNQKNLNAKRRTKILSSKQNKRWNIFFKSLIALMFLILFIIIGCWILNSMDNKYYYTNDTGLFYCYDRKNQDWWQYDFSTREWTIYNGSFSNKIPTSIKWKFLIGDSVYMDSKLQSKINSGHNNYYSIDELDISHSKTFIDSGRHLVPKQGYYKYDGILYYYLDDQYGEKYGTRDNSGWYRYNDYSDSWDYYCDYTDQYTLGNDLYYAENTYAYDYNSYYNWNTQSFESTIWYNEAESAAESYNDSWDSSDSWDSGGTDFSSDW